jgi:hypothetical protein
MSTLAAKAKDAHIGTEHWPLRFVKKKIKKMCASLH